MKEKTRIYNILKTDQINSETNPIAVAEYAWAQYELANMQNIYENPKRREVGQRLRAMDPEKKSVIYSDFEFDKRMNASTEELDKAIDRSKQAKKASLAAAEEKRAKKIEQEWVNDLALHRHEEDPQLTTISTNVQIQTMRQFGRMVKNAWEFVSDSILYDIENIKKFFSRIKIKKSIFGNDSKTA